MMRGLTGKGPQEGARYVPPGVQGRAVILCAGLIRNSTEERSSVVRYDVIRRREDFCPVGPCFNQPVRFKKVRIGPP